MCAVNGDLFISYVIINSALLARGPQLLRHPVGLLILLVCFDPLDTTKKTFPHIGSLPFLLINLTFLLKTEIHQQNQGVKSALG